MKVIEAVINVANLDEVKTALHKLGIEKIMVSRIVINGRRKGKAVINRGAEYMAGFMEKIRVEIIAADELVGRVIEAIGEIASTERKGDCRILIHPFIDAPIYKLEMITGIEVPTMKNTKTLPDPNICRIRMVSPDFFECLVKKLNPKFCSYSMSMGNGFVCKHPDRTKFTGRKS